LTPTVFTLRFEPSKSFSYQPGQFLSVVLPPELEGATGIARGARRIYSFSSPSKRTGYELCVQKVPGGKGSCYLASLRAGDVFRACAPYGDFLFETRSSRNACFIATGTGIAPFKAMVLSERFRKDPPAGAMLLFGARTENEILFPGLFEQYGVEVVHALSQPAGEWEGFKGRATDFLKALPDDWAWQETDFYLCGNGNMIEDARRVLQSGRHVSPRAIHQEAYFSTHDPALAQKIAASLKQAA